jgi:hypothetical protein
VADTEKPKLRTPSKGEPDEAAGRAMDALAHLAIYRWSTDEDADRPSFELLGLFAKGRRFSIGRSRGALAMRPDGRQLCLPNLRDPGSGLAALGFYDLEEDGTIEPKQVPIPGTLDGYGLEKFETKILPTTLTLDESLIHPDLGHQVVGLGYACPNGPWIVVGGDRGLIVWDTLNRRGEAVRVLIDGADRLSRLVWHHRLGGVFGLGINARRGFFQPLAHGVPTGLPRTFTSQPPGAQPGAIPGDPPRVLVKLAERPVEVAVWSERFNRLYAAGEEQTP